VSIRTALGTLASLDAVKRELLVSDAGRDEEIAALADMISAEFDAIVEYPLMYTGTLVAIADLGAPAWASGALAVTPVSLPAPRSLHVEWSAISPGGTVTVTGTLFGVVVTESFVAGTHPLRGTKLFDAITGAAAVGASGDGTVSIGTVKPLVEVHSLRSGLPASNIYLRARPVRTLGEVNEDYARTFAAATRLVANTDYVLDRIPARVTKVKGIGGQLGVDFPEDYIQRFPQKLPSFSTSPRTIRAIYTAGFKFDAERTSVPGDLRNGFLQTVAIRWREVDRKMQGTSSLSDAAGGTTRFVKGDIQPHVLTMLETYKTFSYSGEPEEEE
jgi:hypothetical protein